MNLVLRVLHGVISDDRLTRRLSFQSALFACAAGVFSAGGVLYLSLHAGLSAVEIGIGFTVGAAVQLTMGRWIGSIANRFNPKRVWAACAVVEGVVYVLYLSVSDMVGYLLIAVAAAAIGVLAGAARVGYVFSVVGERSRAEMQSYIRAGFGIGFAVGMLIASLVLFINIDEIFLIPIITGAMMLTNGIGILFLPSAPSPSAIAGAHEHHSRGFGVRGYLTAIGCGVLGTTTLVVDLLLPLWLVTANTAPLWIVGVAAFINGFADVVLQVPLSKLAERRLGIRGSIWVCAGIASVAMLLFAVVPMSEPFLASVLVVAGVVILSVSQVLFAAMIWLVIDTVPASARRPEYQGLLVQGSAFGDMAAPTGLQFIVSKLGVFGWPIISLVYIAAALLLSFAIPHEQEPADAEVPTT